MIFNNNFIDESAGTPPGNVIIKQKLSESVKFQAEVEKTIQTHMDLKESFEYGLDHSEEQMLTKDTGSKKNNNSFSISL